MADNNTIDWNANGWPEPNVEQDTNLDGYSTEGMPDDIFDIWLEECYSLAEWSVDD